MRKFHSVLLSFILVLSFATVAGARPAMESGEQPGREAETADEAITDSDADTIATDGDTNIPGEPIPEETDTDSEMPGAVASDEGETPVIATESAPVAERKGSGALNATPTAGVDRETNESVGNGAATQPVAEDRTNSALGISLAVSVLLGGGLHEKADVRNSFDGGASLGLGLMTRFVELDKFRFGVHLGYVYFSDVNTDRSAVLKVESRKHRLHSTAFAEFYRKAFFVNAQVGAGFMMYSVETTLVQSAQKTVSSNTGFDPGFMTGVSLGLELGEYLLKISREFRLSAYADWTRHDERDELIIGCLISFEIFTNFNKNK